MKSNHLSISILLLCVSSLSNLEAQMPHDAIYMNKNAVCVVAGFGQSTWTEYWENTLKRENLNIGTHTTQSYFLMAVAGITNKLNIMASLPYLSTKTNAGNLLGQSGLQDISVWLKYKLVDNSKGFTLSGALGASTPVGDYVPDFLPMSIGLQTTTASARILANYRHASGLYLTLAGSYTARSNIQADRDAYQANGRVYNTTEVAIPDITDIGVRLGYLKKAIQIESFLERQTCIDGDAIRRNDMPFPTNKMNGNQIGAYLKFQPKNIGINARISQVISGENIGKALTYSAGILYQFGISKKANHEMKPMEQNATQK